MSDEEKVDNEIGIQKVHLKQYGHMQNVEFHKSSHKLEQEKIIGPIDPNKKQSSLLVAIRCRPLLKNEIKANCYEIVRIMDKKVYFYIIYYSK